MIETEAQQLVVDAVKADGGQALKLNNRFLVGVVDLLLKLPGHQPMWLEAKLHKFSAKTIENGYVIKDIGCTRPQKKWLSDWRYAGMLTGVVSFIQQSDSNVSSLRMAVYSEEEMLRSNWSVEVDDHDPLGGKDERFERIRAQLKDFANG
jgi:hypothetical protein